MKICSVCLINKEESEYYKYSRSKDKLQSSCKLCKSKSDKIYRQSNIENYKKSIKNSKNKKKEYYKQKNNEWRNNNKEYNKIYKEINKDKLSDCNKNYYNLNKEKIKNYQKEYKNNRNIKRNLRRKVDNLYKLSENIRLMIYNSFKGKGYSKKSKTQEILGCSFDEFKSYLESKFEPWMNWENKGKYNGEFNYGWDIDHIIPLSSAKTVEDLYNLNSYTNLQPLCSKINRDIKKDILNYF